MDRRSFAASIVGLFVARKLGAVPASEQKPWDFELTTASYQDFFNAGWPRNGILIDDGTRGMIMECEAGEYIPPAGDAYFNEQDGRLYASGKARIGTVIEFEQRVGSPARVSVYIDNQKPTKPGSLWFQF